MQNHILTIVTDYFQLPLPAITQKSRKPAYVKPRFTLCYLLRKYTALSLNEIAAILYPYLNAETGRGCVIWGVKQINNCLRCNDWIWEEVRQVEGLVVEVVYPMKKAS